MHAVAQLLDLKVCRMYYSNIHEAQYAMIAPEHAAEYVLYQLLLSSVGLATLSIVTVNQMTLYFLQHLHACMHNNDCYGLVCCISAYTAGHVASTCHVMHVTAWASAAI